MTLRLASLLVAALALSGCKTLSRTNGAGDLSTAPRCLSSSCTHGQAIAAWRNTGAFCRNVQNVYERRSHNANVGRFGIATFGSLAGSVFAVTSKGTASKAWSGLSGSANGIQSTLNETIGRAVSLQQQQAVRRAYQTGFKAFMEEKDPTNRVAIALATEVECANSGAEGEAKAVLSIYAGAATNSAPLDSSTVARPVPAKPPAPVDPAAPGEPIKPAGN
jgi:hypothetical protein